MKSIENILVTLTQLKNNPEKYGLTADDLLNIDKAIEEAELLQQKASLVENLESSIAIGAGIVSIIEFIMEIFGNSS